MSGNSVYQYVISSSVRVDTLQLLSSTAVETDELIDQLDASTSAVYTALTDLERRSVITEGDDGWTLTGQGRLILDLIQQSHSIEQLFEQDREYWETHRTDVLPSQYRQRLPELGEYEIVRSEPPNVRAHSRRILSRLESAESCLSALHIYVPEYKDAFPNHPDSRAILSPTVIEHLRREFENREQERRNPAITNRVSDIQFGVLIGASFMMLGLPPQDEERMETVLTSTDEEAISWARDLYEHLWENAEPLDSFVERNYS